jgi:hypothetical protein
VPLEDVDGLFLWSLELFESTIQEIFYGVHCLVSLRLFREQDGHRTDGSILFISGLAYARPWVASSVRLKSSCAVVF